MSVQQLTDVKVRKLTPNPKTQFEVWDNKIPGFGVRVSPQGTKSFVLLYRMNGRPRRFTIGRYPALSLSDARKQANAALREVALGNDPADDKRKLSQTSRIQQFDGFVEEFIQKYARRKNRSWKDTERLLKRDFVQKWGKRDVRQISKNDVLYVLDGIVSDGYPSAANHAFRAI
ncbi:MAG: Arm DNA-binding domain-containing protein, partial [Hyphomicrobiales bacterium]